MSLPPCPKSELHLRSLLGVSRKMKPEYDSMKKLQSPHPSIALLDTSTTSVIPKTVTFDDSPEAAKQDRPRQEEKKDDEDDDSVEMRSPHIVDQSHFGSLEEASPGVFLSPGSSEASPSRPSLSPFRVKEDTALESSLVNASLIKTPKPSPSSNGLNVSHRSYPLTREDILEGFDTTDDEDTPYNSNLTTFQRNAIDLAEQESRCYTERIKEVEDRLEAKIEECDELKMKLDRSEAIAGELRDDLLEQEEIAKQQMQRLLQSFQSKLQEMAQSFEGRADVLDEKQSWANAALDRILEDVEFTRHSSDVVSAISSDASTTSNNGQGNDTEVFTSHLGFLGSPHAVMSDPAALPNNQSNDEWVVEKEGLLSEIGNLKLELELAKASSESLKKMLEETQENQNLRTETEISNLKSVIQSKETQLAGVQKQLMDVQLIASSSCRPKQAKTRSFWPRSKARSYKVKSPIKTQLLSPGKLHLKDTIANLRSNVAVLEAKRADLTAALDRVQSECKVHQLTAKKLAKDLGKAKDELAAHKSKLDDSSHLNDKITQLEKELQIAEDSYKTTLKEKGQFRREYHAKIEDLQLQLDTESELLKQREESWKQAEEKCVKLSNDLQHFKELDKDSKDFTEGLKKQVVKLQRKCDELERQKSTLERQKEAYERDGGRPNGNGESTINELKERLTHAAEIESQLAATKYQRDDLLKQLDNIASRLLEIHPESTCRRASIANFLPEQIVSLTVNNENKAPNGIPIDTLVQHAHRRIEELLVKEKKLNVTKEKLQESKKRANELWSKCISWETIHERDEKQLQLTRADLRRMRSIAEQRNVLHTIQMTKTNFQERRAAAFEANCRSQQKELENIASVLFDGQSS